MDSATFTDSEGHAGTPEPPSAPMGVVLEARSSGPSGWAEVSHSTGYSRPAGQGPAGDLQRHEYETCYDRKPAKAR